MTRRGESRVFLIPDMRSGAFAAMPMRKLPFVLFVLIVAATTSNVQAQNNFNSADPTTGVLQKKSLMRNLQPVSVQWQAESAEFSQNGGQATAAYSQLNSMLSDISGITTTPSTVSTAPSTVSNVLSYGGSASSTGIVIGGADGDGDYETDPAGSGTILLQDVMGLQSNAVDSSRRRQLLGISDTQPIGPVLQSVLPGHGRVRPDDRMDDIYRQDATALAAMRAKQATAHVRRRLVGIAISLREAARRRRMMDAGGRTLLQTTDVSDYATDVSSDVDPVSEEELDSVPEPDTTVVLPTLNEIQATYGTTNPVILDGPPPEEVALAQAAAAAAAANDTAAIGVVSPPVVDVPTSDDYSSDDPPVIVDDAGATVEFVDTPPPEVVFVVAEQNATANGTDIATSDQPAAANGTDNATADQPAIVDTTDGSDGDQTAAVNGTDSATANQPGAVDIIDGPVVDVIDGSTTEQPATFDGSNGAAADQPAVADTTNDSSSDQPAAATAATDGATADQPAIADATTTDQPNETVTMQDSASEQEIAAGIVAE